MMTEETTSPMPLVTLEEAAAWLKSHDRYLILTHANPDGDTLGCGIGLRNMLRMLGKTAYCINPSRIPYRLSGITEEREFLLIEQLPAGFLWDHVISVDIASPSLMGAYAVPFGEDCRVDLAIDHHGTHTAFAKQILLDGALASCAELIFDLGCVLFGWSEEDAHKMPVSVAEPLYAGLNTDSGSFKYNAVTPKTHHRAAVMLASGMDHSRITARIYGSRPVSEVYAAKAAYENLQFCLGGQVTLVTFTEEIMQKYRLRDEDISDVVNLIRGIQGVRCAIHIKPRGTDTYKLSLRCENGVNVAEVCAKFGGGGHPCAAGCTITADSAKDAEAMILSAVSEALAKADQKEV